MEGMMRRWLAGTGCSAPCWEHVAPGEMTAQETWLILEQHPLVGDVFGWQEGPGEGVIYWEWEGLPRGFGLAYYRAGSGVHTVVVVDPFFSLTLQDVMAAYGEPSHVRAWRNYQLYGLEVIYLPQGFSLSWIGDSGVNLVHGELELAPGWRDFYLTFFEPGEEGYLSAHKAQAGWFWGPDDPCLLEHMAPWRGMLGFREYYVPADCE